MGNKRGRTTRWTKPRKQQTRPDLRATVRQHIHHHFETRASDDGSQFLAQLPRALRSQLLLDMNSKIVASSWLFAGCDPALVGAVCSVLRRNVFMPGEQLCKEGEVVREMFFLESGKVAPVHGDVACRLRRGCKRDQLRRPHRAARRCVRGKHPDG